MVWVVALAVLIVAIGVGLMIFYRYAQRVDGELGALPNGAPPPMYGGVARRIRRISRLEQ